MFILLLFLAVCVSSVVTFVSTPLLKKISFRLNLVDHPEVDPLKIHRRATPLLGGCAMLLGTIAAYAVFFFFGKAVLFRIPVPETLYIEILFILGGALLVWFFGMWDDLKWQKRLFSNPLAKMFFQSILGGALVGLFFHSPFFLALHPSLLTSAFLTFFFFLLIMNATNLQDGLDGLCTGIVFISACAFLAFSLARLDILPTLISITLLGVTGAFLLFNKPPASIFMGDNGSFLLGFFLSLLVFFFTNSTGSLLTFAGALAIVGMPLCNVLFVIIRRALAGQSPFIADRKHIYDLIFARVRNVRVAVMLNYALHLLCVLAGSFLLSASI